MCKNISGTVIKEAAKIKTHSIVLYVLSKSSLTIKAYQISVAFKDAIQIGQGQLVVELDQLIAENGMKPFQEMKVNEYNL